MGVHLAAREGTSVISIVHGLRKCFYAGANNSVKGKVFGRLGEWTAEAQPLMVEMQPDATWSWEKVDMATSEVQWANFCAGNGTGGKLWQPAANLEANMIEEKVQLPRLLYLPAPVALFAIEGNPKTAIEIFNFVKQYVLTPETAGATLVDADLILKWLMAAGQVELVRANNKAAVALTPLPVFETAHAFQKWAKQKMTGYLGEETVPEVAVHSTHAGLLGGQSETYVKEMSTAIKDLAHNQGQLQQFVRQTKVENTKVLDDFDLAALKAW
jgi:hypothetical protein